MERRGGGGVLASVENVIKVKASLKIIVNNDDDDDVKITFLYCAEVCAVLFVCFIAVTNKQLPVPFKIGDFLV